MSKVALNLGEIAQKNAIRSRLLADSDAWLAGDRVVVELPAVIKKPEMVLTHKPKVKAKPVPMAAKKSAHLERLKAVAELRKSGATYKQIAESIDVQLNSVAEILKKCRKQGFLPNLNDDDESYNNKQKLKAQANIKRVCELRAQGLKHKEISEIMGISIQMAWNYLLRSKGAAPRTLRDDIRRAGELA